MKNIDVLLGLQWGDEGKGKAVDFLTLSLIKKSVFFLKLKEKILIKLYLKFN